MPRLLFLAASYLLLMLPAAAQPDYTGIKTEEGILLVWNEPNLHFALHVRGDEIQKLDAPSLALTVDGLLLQVVPVPVADLFPGRAVPQNIEVSEAHRSYELAYFSEALGPQVTSSVDSLSSTQDYLVWDLHLPPDSSPQTGVTQVESHRFISYDAGDFVLALSSVVVDPDGAPAVTKFLVDTIGSVEFSEHPLDPNSLRTNQP